MFLGQTIGLGDLITVDMGGTSYDICLIKDGRPVTGTENWVGRYHVAVPMIDVHSIGPRYPEARSQEFRLNWRRNDVKP